MDLMWFLMLAHLVGDYALQTDRMAAQKGTSLGHLTAHIAVYVGTLFVTLWIYGSVTGLFSFWTVATLGALAVIFVIHWVQDFSKSRFFNGSKQAYYIDQTLHILQLFLLRWWLV